MADKKTRNKHPKFFKGLTIFGSVFGIIVSIGIIALLVLSLCGVNYLLSWDARYYTAQFVVDGYIVSQADYRRGDVLERPENPYKESTEYADYTFMGWDITGEGVPDVLPYYMYYSFSARAVFNEINHYVESSEEISSEEPSESTSGFDWWPFDQVIEEAK